jgi:hypothetical protein
MAHVDYVLAVVAVSDIEAAGLGTQSYSDADLTRTRWNHLDQYRLGINDIRGIEPRARRLRPASALASAALGLAGTGYSAATRRFTSLSTAMAMSWTSLECHCLCASRSAASA